MTWLDARSGRPSEETEGATGATGRGAGLDRFRDRHRARRAPAGRRALDRCSSVATVSHDRDAAAVDPQVLDLARSARSPDLSIGPVRPTCPCGSSTRSWSATRRRRSRSLLGQRASTSSLRDGRPPLGGRAAHGAARSRRRVRVLDRTAIRESTVLEFVSGCPWRSFGDDCDSRSASSRFRPAAGDAISRRSDRHGVRAGERSGGRATSHG